MKVGWLDYLCSVRTKNTEKMEKYHIGQEIEKEVRKQYSSIDAFAKELNRERTTVYEMFKRSHIATDRLMEVSRILHRDFFKELSEVCMNGEPLTQEDEGNVSECVSLLLPEDELRLFAWTEVGELFDEFFLQPRKKPLVVFSKYCAMYNEELFKAFDESADAIFGRGSVETIMLNKKNRDGLEAMIPQYAAIPQKVLRVRADGNDSDFLAAERLVSETGKHVVLFCGQEYALREGQVRDEEWNSGYRNSVGLWAYDWFCERFDTWHERIHAFIADDDSGNFARLREIHFAANPQPQHTSILNDLVNRLWHEDIVIWPEDDDRNLILRPSIELEAPHPVSLDDFLSEYASSGLKIDQEKDLGGGHKLCHLVATWVTEEEQKLLRSVFPDKGYCCEVMLSMWVEVKDGQIINSEYRLGGHWSSTTSFGKGDFVEGVNVIIPYQQ